jgi:hypothetical protein
VGGALAKGSAVCHAGLLRLVDAGVTALWGAVTISLAVALAVLPICLGPGISVGAGIAAGAVLALGLLLFRHRREPLRVAGFVSTLAAVFVLSAASIVPALDALWLSRSAARLLARYPLQLGKAVLSIGYHEPSLVFLLGTTIRLVTAEPGDTQLAGAGIALVRDRDDAAFRGSLAARGLNVRAIGQVRGLDYASGGGSVVLILYDLERD